MKKTLRKIWNGWKRFAKKFAQVQSEIILFIFYYLLFTPYGLLLKIFGHDPLQIRKRKTSTWKRTDPAQFDLEKLKRQS